ncbi:beta-defensin 110-like [Panthera onca]|uniref:beta-defensin 110-like n=1 Tax=Panthera onca TaxID=9690 RepID=UPI0029538B2D|nr:beta-defensin 110-like [Panthera onca]
MGPSANSCLLKGVWYESREKPEVTEPMYRFERCKKLKGICKTFCNDHEYDYRYCIKWRNQCCI